MTGGTFERPKHPIMDIKIATLCDFAADYNGKLVVSGTFDTLAARALPVVHPMCSLALRFCFTQEDVGRHKLSINIINEDGESLDPPAAAAVRDPAPVLVLPDTLAPLRPLCRAFSLRCRLWNRHRVDGPTKVRRVLSDGWSAVINQ